MGYASPDSVVLLGGDSVKIGKWAVALKFKAFTAFVAFRVFTTPTSSVSAIIPKPLSIALVCQFAIQVAVVKLRSHPATVGVSTNIFIVVVTNILVVVPTGISVIQNLKGILVKNLVDDGRDAFPPFEFSELGKYRIWIQVKSAGNVKTGIFDLIINKPNA